MIVPIVLSGGPGSRLWPVSRESHPKPFIKLVNGISLLQDTYLRAANIQEVQQIITVTNSEYYFQSKDEVSGMKGLLAEKTFTYLLEPVARNTAPAIAMSALLAKKLYGDDAILLVLPADHLVRDPDRFNVAVSQAINLAKQDFLVTFGIIPNKPETGYGYIECGASCDEEGSFHVRSFYEKPSVEVAEAFLAQGNFLWNSGIFCFKVKAFCDALNKYAPDFYARTLICWQALNQSADFTMDRLSIDEQFFANLPNISIDYILMEKAERVAVVPGDFGWSDVGSWDAISEVLQPDSDGNRVVGDAIFLDSKKTTIYNDSGANRMIAAIGLDNLMIVDTPDALLVSDLAHMQQVKQVVDELKIRNHQIYKLHQTVHRPWGTYTVLEESMGYKLKRIVVKPGARLSLQVHAHRNEHWIVVSGQAQVVNNDTQLSLKTGESTFIPAGNRHRLSNLSDHDLVLIEVQTGNYLGEDDIVRIEDIYERG